MPAHSSVLGATNTDDPEAAAIKWERKRSRVQGMPLLGGNPPAVEEESENIAARPRLCTGGEKVFVSKVK